MWPTGEEWDSTKMNTAKTLPKMYLVLEIIAVEFPEAASGEGCHSQRMSLIEAGGL